MNWGNFPEIKEKYETENIMEQSAKHSVTMGHICVFSALFKAFSSLSFLLPTQLLSWTVVSEELKTLFIKLLFYVANKIILG